MLKIRMQRIGRINSPAYRIVVAEHTVGPKSGKIVEKVGTYNPKSKERNLNTERIAYWMSVGAQPSDTVHNMLISEGVIKGDKINVLPKNKNKPAPVVEAPAAQPAPTPVPQAEGAPEAAPVEGEVEAETETPAETPAA
jgi:small subunit ribosomal protein S16